MRSPLLDFCRGWASNSGSKALAAAIRLDGLESITSLFVTVATQADGEEDDREKQQHANGRQDIAEACAIKDHVAKGILRPVDWRNLPNLPHPRRDNVQR